MLLCTIQQKNAILLMDPQRLRFVQEDVDIRMNCPGSAALIADDDDFFRLALRVILIEQLGINEIIETETLDDAIETMAGNDAVRFAFFDLNMSGLDTFTGIRATREAFPDVRVAVVSASCNRYDVLRALDAGAHGFVPKGEGVKQLGNAIKRIGEGEIYIPAFLTDIRNAQNDSDDQNYGQTTEKAAALDNITPRQQDVLNHLVKGMSNKEIARALNVSESAVKFHIASLCGRLGVKNRTEIAVRVSRLMAVSGSVADFGQAGARSKLLRAAEKTQVSPEAVIASLRAERARNGARTAPWA